MIRRLWADNYKSLRNFELELRSFNVLVGANASGKTNIIDMLRFIRDAAISWNGLAGAVGQRGGLSGVASNIKRKVSLGLTWDIFATTREYEETGRITYSNLDYELIFGGKPRSYQIISERVGEFRGMRSKDFLFVRNGQKIERSSIWLDIHDPRDDGDYVVQSPIELAAPSLVDLNLYGELNRWQFVDLELSAVRAGSPLTPHNTLLENGGNLPDLLQKLSPEEKERVVDAMRRDVVGFRDYKTVEAAGRVFLSIDETHAKNLPASNVSDGTLKLLCLYSIVYGQGRPHVLCFEEPENGLHPELIETLVEYLRLLSEETQVIITTHSPLLLDWCRPEEVVLIDKLEGSTRAMRVDERSQIREFLQEWTLGDLWTRELLPLQEVGNGLGAGSTR